nr:hypothetical protein [Tanacetum cinerariifolium]
MQAGWRSKYYVNGLEVQLTLIKDLRRLFHLGPTNVLAGYRSKREPMKEQCDIIYNWKAEVERRSRLQKLLDEENELKRSLSTKAMTAEEPTLIEEDEKQTAYYEAAEDEGRLKKHAEEIGVAKEDAKRKLTEEHNRVYRLQETLDALRATISNESNTGWARATKFLKGESPEKIAPQFVLNIRLRVFMQLLHPEPSANSLKSVQAEGSTLKRLTDELTPTTELYRPPEFPFTTIKVRVSSDLGSTLRTLCPITRNILLEASSAIYLASKESDSSLKDLTFWNKISEHMHHTHAEKKEVHLLLPSFKVQPFKLVKLVKLATGTCQCCYKLIEFIPASLLLREYKAKAYHSVSELTELYQCPLNFMNDLNSLLPLSESRCPMAYGSTLRTSNPITRNEVTVMIDIDEIYARASKEESDLTAELNKIKRIGVLEKKLLTSIAQLQEECTSSHSLKPRVFNLDLSCTLKYSRSLALEADLDLKRSVTIIQKENDQTKEGGDDGPRMEF